MNVARSSSEESAVFDLPSPLCAASFQKCRLPWDVIMIGYGRITVLSVSVHLRTASIRLKDEYTMINDGYLCGKISSPGNYYPFPSNLPLSGKTSDGLGPGRLLVAGMSGGFLLAGHFPPSIFCEGLLKSLCCFLFREFEKNDYALGKFSDSLR